MSRLTSADYDEMLRVEAEAKDARATAPVPQFEMKRGKYGGEFYVLAKGRFSGQPRFSLHGAEMADRLSVTQWMNDPADEFPELFERRRGGGTWLTPAGRAAVEAAKARAA